MSAAVDYRLRYKALRAKFYPAGKLYEETPVKVNDAPLPKQEEACEDTLTVERDVLDLRSEHPSSPAIIPGFEQFRRVRKIIMEVCCRHNMTETDLMSECRALRIIKARHEAFYRIRQETTWSTPRIGKYFGMDHTTVLNGIKKHKLRNGIEA